jgi:hypothetical protein
MAAVLGDVRGKLPGTLADRTIEIRMRRRTADEHVERLRQDRIDGLCDTIRRQAARWADDHLDALQDADPDVPDALHDRARTTLRRVLVDRADLDAFVESRKVRA